MKRILLTMLAIYSVFLVTACPSPASLQKAKDNSSRIAKYADATVEVVRELYRSKTISLAQKDAIADKLILLAKGGKTFDAAVTRLQTQYGAADKVPKSDLASLVQLFNTDVVNTFLDALAQMKIIQVSQKLKDAISLLITSIRVIASTFGNEKSVSNKIGALTEAM